MRRDAPWRRREHIERGGGLLRSLWGRVCHSLIAHNHGDREVSPHILRGDLGAAIVPCFVAMKSHHPPPENENVG